LGRTAVELDARKPDLLAVLHSSGREAALGDDWTAIFRSDSCRNEHPSTPFGKLWWEVAIPMRTAEKPLPEQLSVTAFVIAAGELLPILVIGLGKGASLFSGGRASASTCRVGHIEAMDRIC
jgi:hypothetical protein